MQANPAAWRPVLALAPAVGVFGVSFGVLAVGAGVSPVEACALSALVFAGGAQFAAVGVVAGGGSPLAGIAAGLLLNARYAAFGFALAPKLRLGRGAAGLARRAAAAHLLIDESAALALAEQDRAAAERAFWVAGIAIFVLWNAGTALGALAGTALGDPRTFGLDAAFPAGFLALLAPLLRAGPGAGDHAAKAGAYSGQMVAAAVAGAAITLVLLPVAPAGVPILAAALGVLPPLLVRPARSRAGLGRRRRPDPDARQ